MDRGKVMITGDLNARCGQLRDYIDDDFLHGSVIDQLSPFFDYQSDDVLSERICPDQAVNSYGFRLIQLCIESGVRILNGRHSPYSGDFTYCGPNGCSVIDYVLTTQDMFHCVNKFIIANFNTYSDHSPLHIELNTKLDDTLSVDEHVNCVNHVKYKWNNDMAVESRLNLEENLCRLEDCLRNNDLTTEVGIENCVSSFVNEFQCLMSDFHKMPPNDSRFKIKTTNSIDKGKDNKPWFNDVCKRLYSKYRKALYDFNMCKTPESHAVLHSCKREYKKVERKLKRQYLFDQGNMLESIRKQNPKEFFSRFRKRKSMQTNVNIDDFLKHFKSVCGEGDDLCGNDDSEYDVIYDELNDEISQEEIIEAIKRLKSNKSHGSDGILNEYFTEYRDLLVPFLHKMFNAIMSVEDLDREQLEKEFYPFLNTSAKKELKNLAIEYFLGITGTDQGKDFIGKSEPFLKGIISLTEDTDVKIVQDAYKTLINLTTKRDICNRIRSFDTFDEFITKQLHLILDPSFANADGASVFVSNLTRPEECAAKVAGIVQRNSQTIGVVKIVNALCNLQYNIKANLHYLASILANLTQVKSIRSEVLARDQYVIQKLLPFVDYQDSSIRRHGVVCCLRNCCFEPEHHEWLLGDQVDLLPRLLLPLAGGEEFDEDDTEKLPDDLQYLPPDKQREKEPEIRKMLVETIFKLCSTKKCRLFIKDKNAYVIMREYHKWEPVSDNDTSILNLIDILIQDEPEPGMENLHEVEIPDDVQKKFEKELAAENK
ncbi:hypothetical protein FSP39_016616 [Pinctada imbricata]|uniref:Protein HGH1 homolog n=1 Tax=Pinctada imbricata TaxID=66713 RepID=A0AA89BMK1_PINIB|nr:hypothetical protein FSP39_016616 [Pinctada imbricata]